MEIERVGTSLLVADVCIGAVVFDAVVPTVVSAFAVGAVRMMLPLESTTVPFGRVKYWLVVVAIATAEFVVVWGDESERVASLIACCATAIALSRND